MSTTTAGTAERSEQAAANRETTIVGPALGGLRLLLGLVMVLSGGSKLAGADMHVQQFEQWDYPQWFRIVTGGTEVTGGAGLLLGRGRPRAGTVGGMLIAGTMVGAVYTHPARAGEPITEARRPAALLLASLLVTGGLSRRLHGEIDRSDTEAANE